MIDRDSIDIPLAAVYDMSAPGRDAAPYVARWASLIERPASCTPEALARFVREYGLEAGDDESNWRTALWILACDIREEGGR
ncbi:MAG: hypothetical protein ACRC4O_10960 [Giesbergeria sp.]